MSKQKTNPDTNKNNGVFCNVDFIHGFDGLFGPDTNKSKIRFGSTLLVSGPPGAGKTTFALAAVRAMMSAANSSSDEWVKKQKTIAYFISSEVRADQLLENSEQFGWFARKGRADPNTESPFQFRID